MHFLRKCQLAFACILTAAVIPLANATEVPGPIVDAEWLAANLDGVVILDVRNDTKSFTAKPKKAGGIAGIQGCGGKKGADIQVAGHIPGAALVSWKQVRQKREIDGVEIDKLIPSEDAFTELMQSHGVNKDSAVVIVSKGATSKDMTFTTRLYWQLKYYGQDNLAVLDGGTAKWAADGHSLSRDKSDPARGDWEPVARRDALLATTAEVSKAVEDGTRIIDARTEDYYLGTEQKDYVYQKGHISGAKNFPHTLLVSGKTAATFLPAEDLAQLMEAKGIDPKAPAITYCDSGHLSTGAWFVMHELLGNTDARLYDGSAHEWTKDASNPMTAMQAE